MLLEVSRGDHDAAERRLSILAGIPSLEVTDIAKQLAKRLIARNALPSKAVQDALHIAIASNHGMDYLLTWNFKHIGNAVFQERVREEIRMMGFEPPIICSPQNLMEV